MNENNYFPSHNYIEQFDNTCFINNNLSKSPLNKQMKKQRKQIFGLRVGEEVRTQALLNDLTTNKPTKKRKSKKQESVVEDKNRKLNQTEKIINEINEQKKIDQSLIQKHLASRELPNATNNNISVNDDLLQSQNFDDERGTTNNLNSSGLSLNNVNDFEESCSNSGKKMRRERKNKDENYKTGRWLPEEHQRFIEAILKYGNEWKKVQKHVGSRSSTQARSHAQKFFVKIGKTQIENLQLDFENNSLKSLNIMANNLNNDQMARAIRSLNALAFDKKNSGRKNLKHSKTSEDAGLSLTENKYELNLAGAEDKDSQLETVNGLIFFNRDDKLQNQNLTPNDNSVIAIQTFNKR